jgi:16S rRNA (uracil1498-N3)-methyltransferase
MIRLYTHLSLTEGGTVSLTDNQVHYLYHVMRRTVNDEFLLFNGQDGEWLGRAEVLTKKQGIIRLIHQTQEQTQTQGPVLAISLIKKDNFDLVLQKATELGVQKIIPLLTERTVVSKLNMDRAKNIVIEAAEQCERLDIPQIVEPMSLKAFLQIDVGQKVYLSERGRTSASLDKNNPLCFVIGPEGGWSSNEITAFEQLDNTISLNLGRLILRAETAAIGVLAAYQFDIFS